MSRVVGRLSILALSLALIACAVSSPAASHPNSPSPTPTATEFAASAAPANPSSEPSASQSACPTALLSGFLVERDGQLMVSSDGGPHSQTSPVEWQPWEYDVISQEGHLVVVDVNGVVRARTGDHISAGGGEINHTGVFTVCGPIVVDERHPTPPSPNAAEGACSASVDNIPMVKVQSGEVTVAAAYEVTGQQMSNYFTAVLNHGDGSSSNGADWWNSATKIVDMCVLDGDFATQTPGPPGHDTNATRVLVVIFEGDAFPWAFCFSNMASCSIPTTDPAAIAGSQPTTLASPPSALISPLPTCSPIELPDLGPTDPTSGGFGHVQPPILDPGAQLVTVDEVRAKGFDIQLLTTPYPLVALLDNAAMSAVYEFFGPSALDENTTINDLINAGGVYASQHTAYGHDAEKVKSELGDKAFIIDLGPYDASLSLGESLEDGGRRPYDVYWSDGTYDWSVVAGTDTANEAVAVARSNYCA